MGSRMVEMMQPLQPDDFLTQTHKVLDFIADYYRNIENYPVLSQVEPGYLRKSIPDNAPYSSETIEAILQDISNDIIPGLTHWQSPNFFAYFQVNASTPGFLGEMLCTGFNVIPFCWITSPAATELESIVMDWMGKMLKLPSAFLFSGNEGGGGVLYGSTSEAAVCTMAAARDRALKKIGWDNISKLVVYASDQTHFTFRKVAKIIGIKPSNFRLLPTSAATGFALSPDVVHMAMKDDVALGLVPMYLCATVGTTGCGAVDPIEGLGLVANEYGVWLHVDAAYAGSACICPEFRHYLDGVELVDSFSLNPYKWLLTNMDCCCLWVKSPSSLQDSLSCNAEYLSNNASETKAVIDYKDWQIAVSRRFRAMKLWVVIRRFGVDGLREHLRSDIMMAEHFEGLVGADPRFEVVVPRSSNDTDGALVGRLLKHSGHVRGLEFNINSPNLLASGAEEGELCIWDLSNPAEPTHFPSLKGTGAQGEVSFLSWNQKVKHILASTSYNGTTMIWDLKRQKPVISFSEPNTKRCSVLQWNPDLSTQLIVASDDDSSPSLRLWDMRNTISPLKEFVGHTKGVIAMSWCRNDTAFLLTCAKDDRTICWDTITGESVCELPSSSWNFDIHWYPRIPGVISTSSFDGIGIYNIEACSRVSTDDSDFTSTLSSTGSSVHLRAPKWLKRPTGASFGFGGRLVSFHPSSSSSAPSSSSAASPVKSEVYVHNLVTELSLVNRSTEFEAAIQNGERVSLRSLCDKKSQESESEDDRETWGFLKVMFEDEGAARTKLLVHLGFNLPTEGNETVHDELAQEITESLSIAETTTSKTGLMEHSEVNEFSTDNGEDFFNNLQTPKAYQSLSSAGHGFGVESGEMPNGEQEQEFEGLSEPSDASFDADIQRALIVGDYEGAVHQCISANKMADALVIAHVGGNTLWQSTRDQYLKKSHSSYLKVVSAIANNDLMSLVKTRPVSTWKETLALLCTFAEKEEWSVLCDTLASRLMVAGNTLAATLCYICAGNIDKTVEIWSRSLKCEHSGRTYVDLLQDLMEKTIILALATGQNRFSASLTKLVENYAELLASQGLLVTAMEYLKLLESEGSSHELAILRERIVLAAEEKEAPKELHVENSQLQTEHIYGADVSSLGLVDGSQHYYQDKLQPQRQQSITGNFYSETHQPINASYPGVSVGGYQSFQQNPQFQEYATPAPFQQPQYPSQPQMFVPTQASQVSQPTIATTPATNEPAVKTFVPSTPPILKNVEQYQQPTLGSQLYPGVANPPYQAGPPGPGSHGAVPSQLGVHPGHKMPQVVTPTPSFVPSTGPGFLQKPGMAPMQPPSPVQPSQSQSAVAPPAPPPTVQAVDTSNVPAELRPAITTLTRLYKETSEALGGSRANPAKKREIEDNSRKIGSLFAKLNGGDISPNAAAKLCQLCQALDSGDFAGALQIQVGLTTSDWDECNFWLAALKRMIKMRQNMR